MTVNEVAETLGLEIATGQQNLDRSITRFLAKGRIKDRCLNRTS